MHLLLSFQFLTLNFFVYWRAVSIIFMYFYDVVFFPFIFHQNEHNHNRVLKIENNSQSNESENGHVMKVKFIRGKCSCHFSVDYGLFEIADK